MNFDCFNVTIKYLSRVLMRHIDPLAHLSPAHHLMVGAEMAALEDLVKPRVGAHLRRDAAYLLNPQFAVGGINHSGRLVLQRDPSTIGGGVGILIAIKGHSPSGRIGAGRDGVTLITLEQRLAQVVGAVSDIGRELHASRRVKREDKGVEIEQLVVIQIAHPHRVGVARGVAIDDAEIHAGMSVYERKQRVAILLVLDARDEVGLGEYIGIGAR